MPRKGCPLRSGRQELGGIITAHEFVDAGLTADRILQYALQQVSPGPGMSPIEPEHELVAVGREVLGCGRSHVRAEQQTLE